MGFRFYWVLKNGKGLALLLHYIIFKGVVETDYFLFKTMGLPPLPFSFFSNDEVQVVSVSYTRPAEVDEIVETRRQSSENVCLVVILDKSSHLYL